MSDAGKRPGWYRLTLRRPDAIGTLSVAGHRIAVRRKRAAGVDLVLSPLRDGAKEAAELLTATHPGNPASPG